jgi:aspartyl-tRNA(Asn)/glutamyl-tRNA(Gln) amidotransferase subunit A
MALSWTLDKLGPMCRTADDCGLVLAALAGPDPLDPSSANRTFAYAEPKAPGKKKFKVGVIKGTTTRVQPEVKKNFQAALKVLGDFAEIEEDVKFPALPYDAAVSLIIRAEGASAFQDLVESGRARELRSPNFHFGLYSASMVLAVDYLQAMRLRGRMKRALDELYAKYDALVSPSRATVAYPLAVNFDKAYPKIGGGPSVIPAGNIAGQPALSVPNGFGAHGLPTGIQFTGRVWGEDRLIALAHAYQQATEWHKKKPPIGAAKNS